jgi:hypothetical protein
MHFEFFVDDLEATGARVLAAAAGTSSPSRNLCNTTSMDMAHPPWHMRSASVHR